MSTEQNQWSTTKGYIDPASRTALMSWVPEEDRDRLLAYMKYDDMYWNDPRQFALRVLESEEPIYVPNARAIVNTTAHFLLKNLSIECENSETKKILDDFLKREAFYSRFHSAKLAGVARGDFVLHMTADPRKASGRRISLVPVSAMNVFPIWDEDQPGVMTGVHIATPYVLPKDKDPEQKTRIRRLTYRREEYRDTYRISREEHILELDPTAIMLGGEGKAKIIRTILKKGYLDSRIQSLPVYWFKNHDWDGEDFGSSELRGIERLTEVVSQGTTDVSGALSLEGLGVYATDGGRPLAEDARGNLVESEWEVAPGKVMEVPAGAYFRRVQGVGSVTPAIDQTKYLEDKMNEALGITDVARGKVEATVAQSGIALAIKFLPTLAQLEQRDNAGLDRLTQLFYDWKTWYEVFEMVPLDGDIVPVIGDKLPTDRAAKLNELNNMRDRKLISANYYRSEMEKLGYVFPEDMVKELQEEEQEAFLRAQQNMMLAGQQREQTSSESDSTEGDTLPNAQNGSNNSSRPNESGGTEADNA